MGDGYWGNFQTLAWTDASEPTNASTGSAEPDTSLGECRLPWQLYRAKGSVQRYSTYRGGHTFFNEEAYVDAHGPVTIGKGVAFGPQVMILTTTHEMGPTTSRAGKIITLPVVIGDGVWIGARVTILPGVTVSAGAVVAASAVVVSDLTQNGLYGGVPAKLIRLLDENTGANSPQHGEVSSTHSQGAAGAERGGERATALEGGLDGCPNAGTGYDVRTLKLRNTRSIALA